VPKCVYVFWLQTYREHLEGQKHKKKEAAMKSQTPKGLTHPPQLAVVISSCHQVECPFYYMYFLWTSKLYWINPAIGQYKWSDVYFILFQLNNWTILAIWDQCFTVKYISTMLSRFLYICISTLCDKSLSVTCDRSVIFSGYSGFLHQ
jgi:hypothetical protein